MIAFSSNKILKSVGALFCIIINVMTLYKTIIYLWYADYYLSEEAHNFTQKSILCFYLPSSVWLICPFLSIYGISSKITNALT